MVEFTIETRDTCALSHKSGVQVVSHISIALTIILCSLSIPIINKSTLYKSTVELQEFQLHLEKILPKEILSSEDQSEDEIRNIIAQNLNKIGTVLFISGVGALGGSLFQFLSSLILLCTLHEDSRARTASQFWSAVTCGVILCFLTSLILLLCLDISPYPYYAIEQIFIIFITIDLLFCIYALWIVATLI